MCISIFLHTHTHTHTHKVTVTTKTACQSFYESNSLKNSSIKSSLLKDISGGSSHMQNINFSIKILNITITPKINASIAPFSLSQYEYA